MEPDPVLEPAPRGLGSLAELRPPQLRVARRLLLRGVPLELPALIARGVTPSARERRWLARWTGLSSRVVERVEARDGARRLVIALDDGERVETVVMGDGGVCVSTQVGCAVGCRFCASGIGGLRRNLNADEILEQVVHARRLEPSLRRVVYMGIGEPTHNLAALLEAAAVLAEDGGLHERSQTLSTVGSTRALGRLAASGVRPQLALSLHSADDALRRELLPHGGHESVRELVAAAEDYALRTGREVQYAWALLAGVNDRPADVEALCALLHEHRGYVNVIPWNHVEGLPFERPSRATAVDFVRALRAGGVFATLRWSAGADAEAACGQLRRRRAPA